MTGLVHILSTQAIFIKFGYIWEAILASGLGRRENVGQGDGGNGCAITLVMT